MLDPKIDDWPLVRLVRIADRLERVLVEDHDLTCRRSHHQRFAIDHHLRDLA